MTVHCARVRFNVSMPLTAIRFSPCPAKPSKTRLSAAGGLLWGLGNSNEVARRAGWGKVFCFLCELLQRVVSLPGAWAHQPDFGNCQRGENAQYKADRKKTGADFICLHEISVFVICLQEHVWYFCLHFQLSTLPQLIWHFQNVLWGFDKCAVYLQCSMVWQWNLQNPPMSDHFCETGGETPQKCHEFRAHWWSWKPRESPRGDR